jgi:hypothetical protein
MNNNNSFDPENQCELSYELLYLLKWLADHEEGTLKKIIARAVQQGFKHKIVNTDSTIDEFTNEGIQHSIVDFLDLLDILLHDSLNEQSIKTAQQQNLMPDINKIDSNICDSNTVQTSLDKTSAHLENYPNANAKELLYKEILKRWKPQTKKKIQH